MFGYLNGIVKKINNNSIIIEVNGIGFLVYVANPFSYKLEEECLVYIYNKILEDEYSLYGFKENSEYELFLKLISVKGLGPKLALPMLATGSIDGIVDAINRENILYLTKFPKIGEKLARQIVLDLKGKIDIKVDSSNIDNSLDELMETLTALGYKSGEIKKIIGNIDNSKSLEDQVKDALRLLLK